MRNFLILIFTLFSLFSSAQKWHGHSVVNFTQGLDNLGGVITPLRSDPKKALGEPQNSDRETGVINFVSLGFGGVITLSLENKIEVTPTTTLIIYETTFGYTKCNDYPEKSTVSVSKDGINFVPVGSTCLNDNTVFDIWFSGLDSIKYVRVLDTSPKSSFSRFSFRSDGYDVDGICVFNIGSLPIELKSFEIKWDGISVEIRVVTATEENSDRIIIEASVDTEKFEYVTDFAASGFSTFDRTYTKKLIYEPKSDFTYFRVVELDFNGNRQYFDMIGVSTTTNAVEEYYFDLLGRRVQKEDAIFRVTK